MADHDFFVFGNLVMLLVRYGKKDYELIVQAYCLDEYAQTFERGLECFSDDHYESFQVLAKAFLGISS